MKSSGFLLALATAIAVSSAHDRNYAQANAAAWAATAAANGAKVIHVVHTQGAGYPAQAKSTQARSAQATAVVKTPQQPTSDKDSQKSLQPLPFPDFGALAIPSLLPDLPQDIAKVIQGALTDSALAKAASGLITAFITAQSTTVPLIVAGVHKGLTDAVNVISQENVTKAVAILADKSQDVIKAFVAKLGELIVSQVDKIGVLIKKLTEVGKFAQATAIGFSVLATLSLIFQNEVLPKIPIDLSHLPIPLEELPHLLEKGPIHLEKLSFWLDKLDPLKNLLEHFGHGPSSGSGADSKAEASNGSGQGVEDAAKAGAVAKAGGATASAGAVAKAGGATASADAVAKAGGATASAGAVAKAGGATASAGAQAAASSGTQTVAVTDLEYSDEDYEEEEEGAVATAVFG